MASGSSSKRLLSEDEDGPDTTMEAKAESSTVQPTSARATTKKKRRAAASPGIVYISRLPPGMTPQKVRHLMARWGEIGKVYAQRRDAPTGYDPSVSNSNKKKKEKHRSADFTEAWVEFLDKSVAKTIANMLNAQVIGGRPGDRWRDDIWTMKYLSGFKWEMLGEQVAYERQAHQSRLRAEIAKSKTEQGEYLKNVELARVLDKRRAKKGGELATHKEGDAKDSMDNKGRDKTYKQRQVVDKASGGFKGSGMDSVLASVFG